MSTTVEKATHGTCEGWDGVGRGITSCDGGADLLRGRRARWWVGNTLMCGTCKRKYFAKHPDRAPAPEPGRVSA